MPLGFAPLFEHLEYAPLVAGWWCDAWGLPSHCATLADYERELARAGAGAFPFDLLAFDEGDVVAVARVKDKTTFQDRFPTFRHWLSAVYVAPAARGRGVASALCREIIAHAAARGVPSLYLTTEALDGGLYARLGWVAIERGAYAGDGVQTLIMGLELR